MEYLQLASDSGYSPAMGALGKMKTGKETVDLYLKEARSGNPVAQHRLGELYDKDCAEQPKDEMQAFRWFRLAADQGFQFDQSELGNYTVVQNRSWQISKRFC